MRTHCPDHFSGSWCSGCQIWSAAATGTSLRVSVSPGGRPTRPSSRSTGYRLPPTTAPSTRQPKQLPRSKTIRISKTSPPPMGCVLKWSGYSGKVTGHNERGVLIAAGDSRLTIPWGSTATGQDT